MRVTQEEHQSLLDRLATLLAIPEYDPTTMVTPADLAAKMNTTKEIARSDLAKLEKAGQLAKIEVRLPNGKKGYAYVEK